MKKNIIKFCQQFPKLHGQLKGRLLHVELVSRSSLHSDFVELDTAYTHDGETMKYYPLPNGLVIILVFIGNKMIPFTTIRKGSDKNLKKYESTKGEWYEFLVEEKQEDVGLKQEALDFTPAAEKAEMVMGI